MEWLPIESAPHAMTVLATRFDNDCGEWVYAVVLSPPAQPFTHWRHLPDPPADWVPEGFVQVKDGGVAG